MSTVPDPVPPLDNQAIERLILAAGNRDEVVAAVAAELGVEQVAAVLADEVAFRADIPVIDLLDKPVEVQLDVVHDGLRVSHVFAASHGVPFQVYPGTSEHAAMVIEYRLVDLVRELYGPAQQRFAGRRRTVPRFEHAHTAHPDVRILTMMRAAHQAIASMRQAGAYIGSCEVSGILERAHGNLARKPKRWIEHELGHAAETREASSQF